MKFDLLILFVFNILVLNYATLAIFGGTGKTGLECAFQALMGKEKVVLFTRSPSKVLIPKGSGGDSAGLLLSSPFLRVVVGDVNSPGDVEKAFDSDPDIDRVIVTLGGRTREVGPTMLSVGTTNVVNSMKRRGIKNIAIVTSIGTGDSMSEAPWSFRLLMWTVMRGIMADKNRQESLFLDPNGIGHDLNYVIARPGQLGEGPPTGVVNTIPGKAGAIQRSDLARFLLRAVSDKNFGFFRKTVSLSSVHGISWQKDTSLQGFDGVTKA